MFSVDVSELTKRNITDRCQVQMAYLVPNHTGASTDSPKIWNARPHNLKTHDELKVLMNDKHASLDMVRAQTLQDLSLQHANMLQALHTQQEELAYKFQRNLFTAFESYAQREYSIKLKPNEPTSNGR